MKTLDHIGIATRSISESLEFFEKQLGFFCSHIEEMPERGIRVAFLPLGNTRIELIESLNEHSEISKFIDKRGPGLHHISFHVDALGPVETMKPFEKGAEGARVAFVHPQKTGGVLVELCIHEP